jgi:hypothetical protein
VHTEVVEEFCEQIACRWTFKAVIYKSQTCRGFVGYGDADPSNVSPLVHGAEMRVAETRAVNRALRKAYGIGICSVEEIGSFAEAVLSSRESKKLPPQPVNGNYGGPKVRDRLCQLIRRHQLDANLVKSYAVDFCGTKTLREASREQVEGFVTHLADWAEKTDGLFLVRVDRAQYRWHKRSPITYEIRFAVLKPKHLTGCIITGRLYCAPKAMWKLSWFLRDFGYDTELLGKNEIDDKTLVDLWGVVKVSEVTVHGIPVLNFDGFAPAARWEELSPAVATDHPGSEVA